MSHNPPLSESQTPPGQHTSEQKNGQTHSSLLKTHPWYSRNNKMTQRTQSFKWLVFLFFAHLTVIATFCIMWLLMLLGPMQASSVNEQEDKLLSLARACTYAFNPYENKTVIAYRLVEDIESSHSVRVTVMERDGTVIADSSVDVAELQNHASRPEIVEALKTGSGVNIRVSPYDGIKKMYVAIATPDLVIRVSDPLSAPARGFNDTFKTGIIFLIVGLILITSLSLISLRRAASPFGHLAKIRTDFVANASHELKTPVAGIKLLTESLDAACADGDHEQVKMFLDRLDHETSRLQKLVSDLMDLSRLEQKRKPTYEILNITDLVEECADNQRERLISKGLSLQIVDKTMPPITNEFPLPPIEIKLILDNLISNAVAYTENGSVTITYECKPSELELSVSDTGIGIAEENLSRIYERFYRADIARSRELGGTGLGLSLVNHALTRVKGAINVETKLEVGTTFTVRIPRKR